MASKSSKASSWYERHHVVPDDSGPPNRLASVSLTPHRFGNILRRRAAGPLFFRRPSSKEGLAMLTHDDNERVTQVGRGTPMGEAMRRYWIPALLARELPEPDCAPVRV